MNPEELEREINQLWEKVSPSVSEMKGEEMPSSWEPQVPAESRSAALEAISLLKRQHHQQLHQWERMVTLKDEALKELSGRLHKTEKELVELRRLTQQADARTIAEVSQAVIQMESARRALHEQQERAAQEESRLRDILDKTRKQLADEASRWRDLENQWEGREQKYLSELHDFQQKLLRSQEQAGKQEDKTRELDDQLKETEKAVAASAAQLAEERKLRESSDREREKALKKAAELTDHLKEIENIWAEERKQWQELWDRERSTWESQRQQFGNWEERLRQEREKWHADLRQKEETELKYASALAETLRESAETTAKMKDLLKAAASTLAIPLHPALGVWMSKSAGRRKALTAGILIAGLLVVAYPIWQLVHRVRVSLVAAHDLTLDNPTSIAFDGNVLWASEWSGRLVSLDPANPATVAGRYEPSNLGKYRPASLAMGGNALWSLDNSQSRILRHNLTNPARVELIWASPGPAPVALAYDGQNLWSYDAANKAVYRHMGEGPAAQVQAFPLEADVVPVAMQWVGSELWVYDSKHHQLVRFRLGEKSFQMTGVTSMESGVLSMAVYRVFEGQLSRRMMWTLSGPGPSGAFTLKKYKISL